MSRIEYCEIVDSNIKAVKDTELFGGPNMWHLHIKNRNGWFERVQWMDVGNIQRFFTAKLPVYEEKSSAKYQLEK
jgi:uncharacterized protein YrrD